MLAVRGEGLRKPLAEDCRSLIGRVIERALSLAALTKQDVSHRMGYGTNQAPLSRWIAGAETPQFAKLFAVAELRVPLVIALAEIVEGVEVVTEIRVTRRLAS